MKIYLYLKNKIMSFSLPKKISGSFSFDENTEEESKLINIEARDSNWYMYSTTDVSIGRDGSSITGVILEEDNYYILNRFGESYIIYVTNSFDNSFLTYGYKDDINLLIGNDASCNINLPIEFINGVALSINKNINALILNIKSNNVYLNNIIVLPNEEGYILKSGDCLNIYGFKIIILNDFLLINNPKGIVNFNLISCKLYPYQISSGEQPKEIEFKDIDLYTKEQYFSKAPRIRRLIKTKEINFSPPPKQEGETQMPLILTIGPMLTMGVISGVMLINVISKIMAGTATLANSWPTLATSSAMLISVAVWPTLTRNFNKKLKEKKKQELISKYTLYLEEKRKELLAEAQLQTEILTENLIPVEQCLTIIDKAKIYFWDKRIEQNDFLDVRIGRGNELLDVKINYPEEGFTVEEDDLRKKADAMVEEFKYIKNVPIGYSLYKDKITAIMGITQKCYGMIENIILQLITFYSYEDIKIVIFTNDLNEEKWDYVKYLNHNLSNDKSIRFFSTNLDSAKKITDYLNYELQNRMQLAQDGSKLFKPYYIIITDDYSQIKRQNFTKDLTEIDINLGFSLIILENYMSKLPSKCNNFINLGQSSSGVLRNSFESQEIIPFYDEINYNIDMMSLARKLSNIPIEFEEGNKGLPNTITFLEMEKVGKIEQLNIMNRWDINDSTTSLKAEIGVDEEGNLMYLDLHEKFHGPHGLVAGMTGSGKSEFIITYILSMAINYSPDDVSFILIDYKGGGLAFAFENKATGVCLPHLAGTITNLDKAEMDRTLVSIDSEIKRRQKIFNDARDKLGESTINIYKYQQFYKEGRLTEPIPHLFIICDEFAELKSQQPDFMDNLISVARIGRSLGVHLILATQKPSGVVNDQIWSNTKFRVCLKVQDESDSKEMLKRPEAASIKQTGRFYLQVGYDEYFALGQSAWCGAKYFPSEKIVKQVDKSVNFIDDSGTIIKSIQAGNNIKIEAQGEQLARIMESIIDISNKLNKKAKRLWLNDIDPIILVDNLEKKYNLSIIPYYIKSVIGEYDAPEMQEQGLLTYDLTKDGNTIIYGNDEVEKEKVLNTMLYSICKNHFSNEINIYIIDYGSEQLRMFEKFPQIGGMVFMGEDEKLTNLFKLIDDEVKKRKKVLVSYGGSIEIYNSRNSEKMSQILFVINNYDGLLESYNSIYENIITIARDCERYGIYIVLTCNSPSSLGRRVSQCFNNSYALHLTDASDYFGIFNMKSKVFPRDILGRGLVSNNGVHEFQTASIVNEDNDINEYMERVLEYIKSKDNLHAVSIPSLPEQVTIDFVEKSISTISEVPIGIYKESLKIAKHDFFMLNSTTISSNKLSNINSFMDSLVDVFNRIPDANVLFIDTLNLLPNLKDKSYNNKRVNYYNSNFDVLIDKFIELEKNPQNSKYKLLYIFYGVERLKTKISSEKLDNFFSLIKNSENSSVVFCDGAKNLKNLDFDTWYSKIKNNTDGLWIGKGFSEQQVFRISKITKEMSLNYKNNYGFYLNDGSSDLIKLIEFNNIINEEDDDND